MSSKLDCYIFAFPAFFNKSEKTSFYKQLPAKPKPFVVCLMRASVRALGTGLARSHAVDNHILLLQSILIDILRCDLIYWA